MTAVAATTAPRRIVVVSDLHANARALDACLERAEALGFDQLVVLGDLLTYGPDVGAVVDRVTELCRARGARLLAGNHDFLYRDLPGGERAYYDTLPAWLRASVDWTLARLDTAAFGALPWEDELVLGPVLFSHANPFGARNFRYLNHANDLVDAARAIARRGWQGGCFGHTHRSTLATVDVASGRVTDHGGAAERPVGPGQAGAVFIANPGSVGQPRGGGLGASFLTLTVDDRSVLDARLERVPYDVATHVAAVRQMGLDQATSDKLASFFAPPAPDGT